ncbi:hypothetical protein JAAARDRAFT_189515 [Jaapia argillacea MUCL 33604]|uniref:Uncharacterized protein n=1 Tax=Jaapia argillacea MUCL 33604 TaxID=933084 RepID=A0A067Q590_9AGAM|nr:hypothetical protein JAAARDRAFT_189515 [Jaapia argillacea MUCL 33604]
MSGKPTVPTAARSVSTLVAKFERRANKSKRMINTNTNSKPTSSAPVVIIPIRTFKTAPVVSIPQTAVQHIPTHFFSSLTVGASPIIQSRGVRSLVPRSITPPPTPRHIRIVGVETPKSQVGSLGLVSRHNASRKLGTVLRLKMEETDGEGVLDKKAGKGGKSTLIGNVGDVDERDAEDLIIPKLSLDDSPPPPSPTPSTSSTYSSTSTFVASPLLTPKSKSLDTPGYPATVYDDIFLSPKSPPSSSPAGIRKLPNHRLSQTFTPIRNIIKPILPSTLERGYMKKTSASVSKGVVENVGDGVGKKGSSVVKMAMGFRKGGVESREVSAAGKVNVGKKGTTAGTQGSTAGKKTTAIGKKVGGGWK